MLNINGKKLCSLCFSELSPGSKICDHCNGVGNTQRYPTALVENTVLAGRYSVGTVLGKGGFGVTYLCYDLILGKKVAIKEFFPDSIACRTTNRGAVSATSQEDSESFAIYTQKFYEEAKLVSKFNGNPNIISVYEFFYENNTAYFVMEALEGMDLKHYIAKNGGKLNEGETLFIIGNVLDALMVVHSAGVLHRDISPDNIYICKNGDIKLIDFGAARQVIGEKSNSLSVILKEGFAPIEQYQKKGVQGTWTDVYALGATLYYTLTGRKVDDAMSRIENDKLDGSGVAPPLMAVLKRMLAVKHTERIQNVMEVKNALNSLGIEQIAPMLKNFCSHCGSSIPFGERICSRCAQLVGGEGTTVFIPDIKIKKPFFKRKGIIIGAAGAVAVVAIAVASVLMLTSPGRKYNNANSLLAEGRYDQAITVFAELGDYEDSTLKIKEAKYKKAEKCLNDGNHDEAIALFAELGDYEDSANLVTEAKYQRVLGLLEQGRVGEASLQAMEICGYKGTQNAIIANGKTISAGLWHHAVGRTLNLNVMSAGSSLFGQGEVGNWNDITAVSAGVFHSVGLKRDGTVVAVGNDKNGECEVWDWTDIVDVDAGDGFTVGVRADGTVIAVGDNDDGQCEVWDWTDIVDVSAGINHTVGLKSDGTVVQCGYNRGNDSIYGWSDIVMVSTGGNHTIGLKSDGTVVSHGYNIDGECNVSGWSDIVAVSAGRGHTVALKKDGTVVATGDNEHGQCNVSAWTDIVAVSAGYGYTIGLKADGTVVIVGDNDDGEYAVSSWRLY